MYQSTFCSKYSNDDLILDCPSHAFVCPSISQARNQSVCQISNDEQSTKACFTHLIAWPLNDE
jgi:hypothetical protein